MTRKLSRRQFVTTSTALGVAAAVPTSVLEASEGITAPVVHAPRRVNPLVVSDISGYRYRNGGPENSVERAFRGIT